MGEVTLREINEKVNEVTGLWLEGLQIFRRLMIALFDLDELRLEYVGQGEGENKAALAWELEAREGDEEMEDGGEDAG